MSNASQQRVVVVGAARNPGVAAVVGLFFGPLGLFYAGRILAAVIMIFVSIFVAIPSAGIGLLLIWPICSIWSYLGAKAYNKKLIGSAS